MILRALRVNQFRKFVVPTGVSGLTPGLNVLIGANELGKSTLVRALQAVLFETHSARSEPLRSLQNAASGAAPVVEVEFDISSKPYLLRKRFIHKPYAKLTLPEGTVLEGEAAEARLRELLGFAKAGTKGAKPETLGLWSQLWIEQGGALNSVEVPDLAKDTLRVALEQAVGAVLGGAQSQRLPGVIGAARDELLTRDGRPRNRYRSAVAARDEQLEVLETLRQRRSGLDSALGELAEASTELARREAEKRTSELPAQLQAALARRDEISQLEQRIEAASLELQWRADARERCAAALRDREQLSQDEQLAAQRERQSDAQLQEAGEQEAQLSERLKAARAEVELLLKRREPLAEALERAERDCSAAELHEALLEKETRLARAQAALAALREQQATIAASALTPERLEAIEAAYLEKTIAASRLSAVATQLHFELDETALARLRIDGTTVASREFSLAVVATTRLEIESLGTITIEPQLRDLEQLRETLSAAEQALHEALSAASVASAEAARAAFREREQLLARERDTAAGLEALLPGGEAAAQSLKADIDALREQLQGLINPQAPSERGPTPQGGAAGLSREAADKARARARAELAELGDALDKQRGLVDSLSSQLDAHREAWQGQREALARARVEAARMRDALGNAPQVEALQSALASARSAVEEQEQVINELRGESSGDSPASITARITRLQQAEAAQDARISGLRDKKNRLSGVIQGLEGAGLDEQIAMAERDAEFASQEVGRYAREAEVLSLLDLTLRNAEADAHQRFMAPVVDKVLPYLNVLFPGAELTLDEQLNIVSLTRGANADSRFERLSMGTREQIFVLTRIAFAELMAEQGRPAMVVLDDSFAYSDDLRMERLFDVLSMAAEKVQILLLSCREQLFEGVGGHALSLETLDEDSLPSA